MPAPYGRVDEQKRAEYTALAYRRIAEDWPWIGNAFLWYLRRPDWEWHRRPEGYFRVLEPDWRETETRHVPGSQPADVAELLDHGAEVVVLSKGMLERLQICPETLDLLRNRGIPAHVLPTADAVLLYNRLATKQKVGGLFHSTC